MAHGWRRVANKGAAEGTDFRDAWGCTLNVFWREVRGMTEGAV